MELPLPLIKHKCDVHPTLDVELLMKITEHAIHSKNWDQEVWFYSDSCGTAMCIAGFVAVEHAGYQPMETNHVLTSHGVYYIDNVAANLLGLNYDEANALFRGQNNADDIRRIRNNIINGTYRRINAYECTCK